MNFLAHIYLSQGHPKVTIGNFIGDFVKGTQIDRYDDEIRKGILLHRAIDHFTDTHEIVKKSKDRLRGNFRHYAPVIVDVFYDHILAREWKKYAQEDLNDFVQGFYQLTMDFSEEIPQSARHMLTYMKRDNWLYNYQFIEGINRALSGMSRRTKFESKMDVAAKELSLHYEAFRDEFQLFFPELQAHCSAILTKSA